MKTSKKNSLLLFFLIYMLSSCNVFTSTVSQPTEAALPTGTPVLATPTLPVPTEGRGVVCGYLLDKETNQPPQALLFLSINIAAGREDLPAMMSFSYQTNPRAEMSEEGFFCFLDVEPGIYALTLWTPPSNTEFVENVDGQDYLWIEVEPGSVIDLGHLAQ